MCIHRLLAPEERLQLQSPESKKLLTGQLQQRRDQNVRHAMAMQGEIILHIHVKQTVFTET